LLYREDIAEVYDRLTSWWNGGDIGRPALLLTAPRAEPIESIPAMPEPEGWLTGYSTRSFEYRVNLSARACAGTHYLAEAVPNVAPDLGPNCLALYLGCRGIEMPTTVWFEPCLESPEGARFERDPANFYWNFTLRLARAQLEMGRGKFLVSFPDLIEGLDTLAAMRGTEPLLRDLLDRPEWVHHALGEITERYFECYDTLYDMFKDERGGSHFWAWAPGRMSKLQCDFSAMISAEMFGEFMVPVLREMTERLDYCMFHWDGPGAIPHHDHLLSIPRLSMIQWTPGAGAPPVMSREWWPLYRKTVESGKRIILTGFSGLDSLRALRAEFGPALRYFMIGFQAESLAEADEVLRIAGG